MLGARGRVLGRQTTDHLRLCLVTSDERGILLPPGETVVLGVNTGEKSKTSQRGQSNGNTLV